ncbi:E3 ubiquitin-protein ligase ZSWIM2 [Epinephelus fuscoguttatus]|uniref:E3 ubiquitin-protein ligase ZSWIM2 n=1 Tax=Epinephelus fuscoguttatus TaxID=293821 RepID=UPI0020D0A0C7|nr:E3 ubiquitin-protein ligase ZSWIM2 [Epinephelus fuscoguttatus]XP_049426279.1 E3 ubiquitin-protein ligase ZSWIM2 [Epinephelus fuscoguttatus]
MFRKTTWRNIVSSAVSFHQDQALTTTIFFLRSFGPTGFLLREEGEARNFKVFLGDPHTCTCPVFTREQELCKHICWVLLRKFRLPREHEYSFQHGLVERQILEVLHGLHQTKDNRTENDPSAASETPSQAVTDPETGSVCRKAIQVQDVCPICQEELLEKKQPVSYCRFGCGNNVHISCMKVWADHQRLSDREETVKCPLCREDFSSLKFIQEQMKNAAKLFTAAERKKPDRHLGVSCHSCRVCPVIGKCFKCTVCRYFYLCEDCSKKGQHPQHPFASRTKRREKWHLVAEELSDEQRGVTSQPGNGSIIPVAADPLPESVLECLPTVRVRSGSRLLDEGQQCRICLQNFSLGQHVRTLPCLHKFHTDCVDRILRKSNSCPLDGYVIYDSLTWSSTERKTSPQSASCLSSDCAKQPEKTLKDLFIPGVALQDRNTKVTSSHTFLNLEVLTDSSVTFNTPQKLITDSFQGLCIATDSMVKEGRRELQRTLIPESSSACDQLSKSDSSAHSSKKTTVKHSPASPNRCAMAVKIREQPQLDLFVGLRRPESNHKATVAFPARRTRVQLKRTGTVTMTDTNNTLISELKMTGVLINTQQQRKKKT